MTNETLQFSRLDTAFSYFLSQRASLNKNQKKDFKVLISKLSSHQFQGHNCIYLNQIEKSLVLASGLIKENNLSPLVLENNRLYLHRYWFYENRLAQQITNRLSPPTTDKKTSHIVNQYFKQDTNEIDLQKEAATKAVTQSFSIITGGPGTGKTTTVVKILAILLELAHTKNASLHIALAAPTGKAAKRLEESINISKNTLPCPDSIKQKIPSTATTLHRLLGTNHSSPYFKHNSQHPLTHDVVIIDEASMIDLALMGKLIDSLKQDARFILLGDKDQLASVESGAVLSDLTTALPDQTIELKKSHRFQGEIKKLADATNNQLPEKAWDILENDQQQASLLEENLIDYAVEHYTNYFQKIKNNVKFNEAFSIFNQFQILCATRHGENGVFDINNKIEERLTKQNKIQITGQWYIGRPIMVTQNNTETQLYNGDIGIYLQDTISVKPAIFFLQPDGNVKKILPSRLPAHETVFAMSIHKSQGSEFDECLCVLPNTMNPILSKELIYTAITRAKTKIKMHCTYSIFSQALQNKVVRTGGLFEKLTKATLNK